MPKFSLGLRNDLSTILKEFGKEVELYEVFGPPPREILASGRIDCAPPDSLDELKKQIAMAHDNPHHSIRFNVLLNALCQHGEELETEFREKMFTFFEFLSEVRADSVTITNSTIMRWAKNYRDKYQLLHGQKPFDIAASAWRDITNLYLADQTLNEFGVDTINFHQYINRDFKTLREIQELKKQRPFTAVLYASTGSTWLCDDRQGHRCAISHPEHTLGKKDFYKEHCIAERRNNPFLIFIAPTIPPEVVELYETLGFEVFKIAGRDMPTEWRIQTLRRYLARQTEPGIGIADLCDTNLGRKLQFIPIPSVVEFIHTLFARSKHADFDFQREYLNVGTECYKQMYPAKNPV